MSILTLAQRLLELRQLSEDSELPTRIALRLRSISRNGCGINQRIGNVRTEGGRLLALGFLPE